MSISKITNSLNCCVVFTPHGCVLQDLATGRMIGSGKQHAGLYYMSPLPNQAHASQISTDPDLWHKRLGHPSPAYLQLVSSLLPIPISKNLIPIHNHCSICPKAKQTMLPFSSYHFLSFSYINSTVNWKTSLISYIITGNFDIQVKSVKLIWVVKFINTY